MIDYHTLYAHCKKLLNIGRRLFNEKRRDLNKSERR